MGQNAFTFAVLGAGGRGNVFAGWIKAHPDAGRVVAVAEPNAERRAKMAQEHDIPPEMQFERWEDLLARPKLADVVLNALMDRLHVASSVVALDTGYHMLLEKPMAVTLEDCIAIDEARRRNDAIVSVCHSLRYHIVYEELKRMIDAGSIGRIVTIDQLEGVGAIHQSHSFVRGNWGNESRSTFMLMAKSCHDMDIMAYLVGQPCLKVSSFGSLAYFRNENAPPGAPARCTDGCPAERDCMYSALKIYQGSTDSSPWWTKHAGIAGRPLEQQLEMLRTGPYGRCVFQADNDVVDHQVVSMQFAADITGTFTMTAFSPPGRFVRIHGTDGYLYGDIQENRIEHYRYRDRARTVMNLTPQMGGHGGADDNVMANFVYALRTGNRDAVLTGTAESLRTHAIAFAAEQARRESRVVELAELLSPAGITE